MQGISVEFSERGMSAIVSGSLKPGDRVVLDTPAGDQISALVQHKVGQMYGFEFVGLSGEQVNRIVHMCNNLADR